MTMNNFVNVPHGTARSGAGYAVGLSPFDAIARAWRDTPETEREAYWRRANGRTDSSSNKPKKLREHKSRN